MKQYNICDRAANGEIINEGTLFVGEGFEVQKLTRTLTNEGVYDIAYKADYFSIEKMYGLYIDEITKMIYIFGADTVLRFLVNMDI